MCSTPYTNLNHLRQRHSLRFQITQKRIKSNNQLAVWDNRIFLTNGFEIYELIDEQNLVLLTKLRDC
jgi:hypothetical protein